MGDTSFGVSDNSDVIILIYFSTYTSRNYHVSEFVIFALKTVLSKYISHLLPSSNTILGIRIEGTILLEY